MLRLILCLILVPALLANQALLCCTHTHGGTEASDHSQLAHVHFHGHSHDSGHDHHHDAPGDHHHHHGDSDQSVPGNDVPVEQSTPTTDLDTNDLGGHDHDAIYFGQQTDLHLPTSQISFAAAAAAAVVPQWLAFESPPDPRSQHKCHQSSAGPIGPLGLYCADQCAIFLQTGCLLI